MDSFESGLGRCTLVKQMTCANAACQTDPRRPSAPSRSDLPWAKSEEDHITWNWSTTPIETIAAHLARSVDSVYRRAVLSLGLQGGCPNGCEYLTNAAARTGFTRESLKQILKHHGTRTYKPQTKAANSGSRERWVHPDAVDAAVKWWLDRETVTAAAARLGVSRNVLERRVECHPDAPPKPPHGHRWYIPSAVIESCAMGILPQGQNRRGPKARRP